MSDNTIINVISDILTINIIDNNVAVADNQYVDFEEFQTQVEKCKEILEDIIIENPNGNNQNIDILFWFK